MIHSIEQVWSVPIHLLSPHHQHHADAIICRNVWKSQLLLMMAKARDVAFKDYLECANASESEHVIDMQDYMMQMMSTCKSTIVPPMPLYPSKKHVRDHNPIEHIFSDTEIDQAVLRFAQLRNMPCDRPIPVQDIGAGEYGGARLRPLHAISLILQGPAMYAQAFC
jgi:hypothetical protein